MKSLMVTAMIIIATVAGIVVPSVQYYNYYAFRKTLEDDTLETILLPFNEINDEKAAAARTKIVNTILEQGYLIEDTDVDFRARVPGGVRFYSEKIFQACAPGIPKTELIVTIRFRYKTVFTREGVITYTKELR